jgi:transposase-like protein
MELSSLPKKSSSLKFSKHNAHIMSLCLTLHVNLGLFLRKTAQAMNDLYGIKISHQMVANYARTAALVIKPFVDNYDYEPSSTLVADETYIKIRGIKGYIWFIMDAVSRSILGYQVSDNRGVGPCILAMRMAFRGFKDKLPENFRFIADGYSAYLLAAQQFFIKKVMLLNLILLRLSVSPMLTLYLLNSDLLSSLSKDLTALSKPLIV